MSQLRIFSYLPNPRIWKARLLIPARMSSESKLQDDAIPTTH
jgi:hypothetical protein